MACGEREAMLMAPPLCMTQQYRLLPWLPGFSPQAFPTTVSSLTSPRSISPQSTAALVLGSLHNPQTPGPSHCTFQGTRVPVQGMYDCSKDYLILIPFRLPQISCFSLSLKCFSSDSDNCPDVGPGPRFRSFTLRRQVQSYYHSCFSSSFLHPTEFCEVLCILFLWLGPPVHSQLVFCRHFCVWSVFLTYPWREMYSTSTYSSDILFSSAILKAT